MHYDFLTYVITVWLHKIFLEDQTELMLIDLTQLNTWNICEKAKHFRFWKDYEELIGNYWGSSKERIDKNNGK